MHATAHSPPLSTGAPLRTRALPWDDSAAAAADKPAGSAGVGEDSAGAPAEAGAAGASGAAGAESATVAAAWMERLVLPVPIKQGVGAPSSACKKGADEKRGEVGAEQLCRLFRQGLPLVL